MCMEMVPWKLETKDGITTIKSLTYSALARTSWWLRSDFMLWWPQVPEPSDSPSLYPLLQDNNINIHQLQKCSGLGKNIYDH